ncbi:hypothetical protein CsSME_00011352 [Camellia sinensis var. sinensis]
MAHKVKDINSMLDLICKEANDIGLKPADQLLNAASTSVKPRDLNFRLTHPFVDDSQVVGRDGDVSTVIDMLIGSYDSGDDLSVMAIVGMGGMGKTTLGQLVYKNKNVVKHFGDQRMWICVSNDFIVKRSLNEMVQSLTRDQCQMKNIKGIVRMLQEKLYGKEYLLVLDDVWNEIADKWECMRNSLLGVGGSKGSKIIATTRSMHVPSSGSNLEMEDVGNNYFNILLHNSLFQDIKLDVYNNIICCKMHDLALDVSESNCLALTWIAGEVNYHPEVKSREEVEKENILGKPNICELGFHWDRVGNPSTAGDTTSINHEDVLEGLKPHGNLKILKLQKFEGQNFASWMMSGRDAQLLQNLVKIELFECTRCEQVPRLGHLPHLEVIRMFGLSNLKRIGPEFYGRHSVVNHDNDGIIFGSCSEAETTATVAKAATVVFPALRELLLDDMPNIEEWCRLGVSLSSSDTTMLFPLLEWLFIRNFPEVITIPSHLLPAQELIICGFHLNFYQISVALARE